MGTSAVHALQWLLRLFCSEAHRVFDHHLGQSDDGIERRAQLVAHAGDELRLVLARHLQLAVLLLNLVEQPHIFDRDYRLVGEGGGELDLPVGERAHGLAAQNDNADRVSLSKQRHAKYGSKSDPFLHFLKCIIRIGQHVGNLDWLTVENCAAENAAFSRLERYPSQNEFPNALPVTIRPPFGPRAKAVTARSISVASRTLTGLTSIPNDGAAV